MVSPEPGDPTPEVGSPTFISASRPIDPGPPHERFFVPAGFFFLVYCFALPALLAYARRFMETRVGPVNVGYLFALSQFFIAWIVAALYVRATNIFDRDAESNLDNIQPTPKDQPTYITYERAHHSN